MTRYDFIIIFSHAIEHERQIMCLIRDFPNIEIEYIRKLNALEVCPTMQDFIEGLYSCDHVPIEHLRGKTAYMQTISPEFIFVLVKNLEPDEQLFGEGEFQHIQCARIKELKQVIRDGYNEPGTHNHVIHASDYESQVEYVLNFLNLPDLKTFRKQQEYNLRYFVDPGNYEIKKIPISKIICRTAFGETSVDKGIWLKYVKGNKKPYTDYIEKVIGLRDFDDHYPEAFDKLIGGFHYRDLIAVEETKKGFLMKDGNHRAAIVRSWGETEIVAIVEKRKYSANPFRKLLSECVVIRRKAIFPHYQQGQDIDLLCLDPEKFARQFEGKEGWVISGRPHGYHIDLMIEGVLRVRLDVVSSLIEGDEKYIREVFERSEVYEGFRYPCMVDEIILRGLEYVQQTQKKWHFDFILDKFVTKT